MGVVLGKGGEAVEGGRHSHLVGRLRWCDEDEAFPMLVRTLKEDAPSYPSDGTAFRKPQDVL